MKAAVVKSFKQPLVIEERPIPELAEGQVLVRIEASGLCHTDIHAARGEWPAGQAQPAVRARARGRGDRAARRPQGHPGRRGRPGRHPVARLGLRGVQVLHHRLGDPLRAPEELGVFGRQGLGRVRAGLWRLRGQGPRRDRSLRGRPAHLRRAHHVQGGEGVRGAPVRPGGHLRGRGLGHLALQYAQTAGAQVVAIDLVDEKLQMAKDLGAAYTVNAREQDPVAVIKVLGSIVGTRVDLQEVFELHGAGKTRVIFERRRLDDVNEAIREVESGRAKARLVFDVS